MEEKGRVFSILDNFYLPQKENSLLQFEMEEAERKKQKPDEGKKLGEEKHFPWIKEYEDMAVDLPKWFMQGGHDIVTDIEGNRVCRPKGLDWNILRGSEEGMKCFDFAYRHLNLFMTNILNKRIKDKKDWPNVMVALGGANQISGRLHAKFRNPDGNSLSQGEVTLAKVIEDDKLERFEFRHISPLSSFNPPEMRVILVEDSVFTGRSVKLAIEFLSSQGAKVMAVLSLFNSLGLIWPFDVDINITFQNIYSEFKKILAVDCLTCKKIYRL